MRRYVSVLVVIGTIGIANSAVYAQPDAGADIVGAPPNVAPSRSKPVKVPDETFDHKTVDGLLDQYGGPRASDAERKKLPAAPADLHTEAMTVRSSLARESMPAHSASTALTETMQLLGQIVADRASTRAFGLVTKQLTKQLQCEPKEGEPALPIDFTTTCDVLERVRMQDLAAAPRTLALALASDLVRHVQKESFKDAPAAKVPGLEPMLGQVLAPLTRGDSRPRTVQDVDVAVGSLVPVDGSGAQDKAVQVGVLAMIAAASAKQENISVAEAVTRVCQDRPCQAFESDIVPVAVDLHVAITAVDADTRPDVPARIDAATSAVARLACIRAVMTWDAIATSPADQLDTPAKKIARLTIRLSALTHGVVTEDGLAIGLNAARLVEDALVMGKSNKNLARTTRLLSTLIHYSATYARADAKSDEAHTARKEILESMVDEFTDRTHRDGDLIVSLGGSLRLAGGVRFGSTPLAAYGPVSLPLGVALDYVGTTGLHLEFGLVDVGEYLGFTNADDEPFTVDEPDIRQAFSPSATIAYSFAGPSMPLILGAVVGASPFRDDAADLHFYAGATIGVYVPLVDLN